MPTRRTSPRKTSKKTTRSSNSGSNSSRTSKPKSKPKSKPPKKKSSKSSASKKIASKIKVVKGSIIQLDPNFSQSIYQVVNTDKKYDPNYLCSPLYKLESNPNITKQNILQMATSFPKAFVNQVINESWQSPDIKKHNLSLLE